MRAHCAEAAALVHADTGSNRGLKLLSLPMPRAAWASTCLDLICLRAIETQNVHFRIAGDDAINGAF